MSDADGNNSHRSRFARWSRAQAVAILAGFLALVVWGLVAGTDLPADYQSSDPAMTNVGLYNAVVDKMIEGEGYYQAINESQAVRGFPTRPFPTVREPALATVESWLGGSRPMRYVLLALLTATGVAVIVRLRSVATGRASWLAASTLAVISPVLFFNSESVDLNEYWAGLLVALSLACLSKTRWLFSVVVAFMAVLVRELALPLLGAIAVYEFFRGRRQRAVVWVAVSVVFLGILMIHAANVEHSVAPSTVQSPGWLKFGGWPFFVDSVRYSSLMAVMPVAVAAIAVPLAMLGWISRQGDFANRITLVLVTYALAFMIVGRPGNFYWGFLFVVVILPGIAFAPAAFLSLYRAARPNTQDLSHVA